MRSCCRRGWDKLSESRSGAHGRSHLSAKQATLVPQTVSSFVPLRALFCEVHQEGQDAVWPPDLVEEEKMRVFQEASCAPQPGTLPQLALPV